MSIKEQKAPAVITLDIAPTLIDIAGLNHLDYGMDGISWWSNLLQSRQNSSLNNTQPAMVEQEPKYLSRHFLIEYHGEGGNGNDARCRFEHEDLAECSYVW